MNIFSKKTGKQIDRCEALTLMLMLVAIGWTMPSPHSYFATQCHTVPLPHSHTLLDVRKSGIK